MLRAVADIPVVCGFGEDSFCNSIYDKSHPKGGFYYII